MKRLVRNNWAALAVGCAFLSAGFTWQAQAQSQTTPSGKLRIVATEVADDHDDDSRSTSESIEIRLDDGKLTVTRNGKEVAGGQIKIDDGNVIIFDKDGNKIKQFNIGGLTGKAGQFKYWMSDAADKIAPMIEEFKTELADAASRPKVMLGIQISEPGPALEYHLELAPGKTAMISGVFEGLAADEAGLKPYDIIEKVDGKVLEGASGIRQALADKEPGDFVTLSVIHQGKSREYKIKLPKYDPETMMRAKLLGAAGQAEGGGMGWWRSFASPEFRDKFLQEWKSIPQMKHLFVAPDMDLRGQLEWVEPEIERRLRERTAPGRHEDVEEQLKRLDQRMAELEKLLQRLTEKQGAGR
jgi:hypothetical protein